MGCDIHLVVEIKENEKWKYVPEVPKKLTERNYGVFGALAGVGDSFNNQIFEVKGLPEDISGKKFNFISKYDILVNIWKTECKNCLVIDNRVICSRSDFENSFIKKTFCEISKELYDSITKNVEDKEEVNKRYSYPHCSQDSSGEYKYYTWDASMVNGEWKNISYNVIYPKITDFLASEYSDDFDVDAGDYGYWSVDFDCDDYHTPSYITLKEFEDTCYDNYTSNKCKVPVAFYKDFCAFGGVLPKEFRVENSKASTLVDVFQEAVEPTMTISWSLKEVTKNDALFLGIEELRTIFAFDN